MLYSTIVIHLAAGVRFGIKKIVNYRKTKMQISQAPQVTIEMVETNQTSSTQQHNVYNNSSQNVDLTHTLAFVTIIVLLALLVVYMFTSFQSDWAPIIHNLALFSVIILLSPCVFWISHPDIYKFIKNHLCDV